MEVSSRKAGLVLTAFLLTACSGGTDPAATGNAGATAGAASSELTPRFLPYAPYGLGSVRVAPADGATISGIVRLEITGYWLRNAELLPPQGYQPKYGVFNITNGYEQDPEFGWLDLDTTKLPNGPLTVRISGFEAPAGENGREFTIMSARTWNVSNPASTSAPLSASVTAAPADGAAVSGTTRLEVSGTGLTNVELLPASGYTPKLGIFNISGDRTFAWLDFDSRSIADGLQGVRIAAYNVTSGQAGATEAIAMPPRQWNVQNGSPAGFTGSVSVAPAHGAVLNGRIRLEVQGSGLENVELLPASGYSPKLGTFLKSVDRTFAWLEFNTANLPNGVHDVRISAFNKPAGAADAREIIVMPARQWEIRN